MFISSKCPSTAPIEQQGLEVVTAAFNETIAAYKARLEAAMKRASEVGFPNLRTDIVRCNQLSNIGYVSYHLKTESTTWNSPRERTAEELEKHVLNLITVARAAVEETHKNNTVAIESNKLLRKMLEELFTATGLPRTRRVVDTKSRSRYTKYFDETTGWYSELSSIVTSDCYEIEVSKETDLHRQLEERLTKMRQAEEAKKKEEEKKKAETVQARKLAVIIARYSFDNATTAKDALEEILNQNKYLRLAHYLEMNRNDWNDGCSYAVAGLTGFNPETAEDNAILAEINNLCADFDGDGRVFRDCTYNYGVLFSMVPQQLLRDYSDLKEMIPQF